ncbi:virulence RhuM family protein [Aliarcobacter butzleri]|uniref:Virulence RhuM family protein n=1 Tax=Aliarcobacter butzleri TaxID=28197 RepID=A0AAW7Q7A7_9BACT|nr:virulence RhuM family protein [Aliarcobacter butzleri]MDN5114817.1 virulence RhuM family protein [Aliarcobacter butzleri]
MRENKTQLSLKEELTDFLLYTTPNQNIKVEVFLHNENLWLPQDKIAKLFGVDRSVITKHIKNIYQEEELYENSTSAKIAQVRLEGNREVNRNINYYNLDMIIAVGYRVNSLKATQFRIWATNVLKEYIIKGFALDDDRMKNGKYFGKDYFKELLERVRSIRASERRIYQQITDIFAECCSDYDNRSEISKNFYANVQNKFHYAITGQTAAEIVFDKADKTKPYMGLKTWKNSPDGRILKSDTTIAKNYLEEDEIKKLERTISSYFDYIENQIEMRNSFTMEQLANSVNKFLEFNDFKILENYGNISQTEAKTKAYEEYEEFNKIQKIESDFDKQIKKILENKKG